jgi:hypothetical protein
MNVLKECKRKTALRFNFGLFENDAGFISIISNVGITQEAKITIGIKYSNLWNRNSPITNIKGCINAPPINDLICFSQYLHFV